jgi:LPXTG-motif cell wall-anchored protein
MKRILSFLATVSLLSGSLLLLTATAASATSAEKVFVCKYVGTPGVDETLQTGQNPISVSVNSIGVDPVVIGSYFNDAHGRSYVLAFDTGQDEPDVSQCPGSTDPTTTTTIQETTTSEQTTTTTIGTTTTTTDGGTTTTIAEQPTTTTTISGSTTTSRPDTTTTSGTEPTTTTALAPSTTVSNDSSPSSNNYVGTTASLASTGSNSGTNVLLGLVLIVIGGILIGIRRRYQV